jgi:acyl-CoA hydrolase
MTPVRPRRCSAREAAALVRPEDSLGVPLGPGQPGAFLHALGERDDLRALTVFTALLVDFYPLFTRPGVRMLSGFFGPVERALRAAGHRVEFLPAGFRAFEEIARRLRPRVVATAAAPPDAQGRLSLSLHSGATFDELRRAGADPERLLVVEANARLPRTLGLPPQYPHSLGLEEVDVLVESDRPPFVIADPEPGPAERAIAATVRRFVPEGATLQTGIGGVPSEVAQLPANGPGCDYGVHSEMFTTGLMKLHLAGKVSNRKGVFDGFSVATFAAGTSGLYDWLDGNPEVRFLPVGVVNDPALVTRNRHMVSINGALTIDLYGQVAADSIAGRQYSGIGGHEDFVMAAAATPGGRSLLCLPSTSRVDGSPVSRIVAELPPGTTVTTPRHHVDVVITEYGAAELAGRTVAERASALAQVAHPDFRDELTSRAEWLAKAPA